MTSKKLNQIIAKLSSRISFTTITSGRKVVTSSGTAETLGASTTIKEVVITAESDNTQIVVVGGSTVVAAVLTRLGTPLAAGVSETIKIDDLAKVYVDSMIDGEGVTFNYYT